MTEPAKKSLRSFDWRTGIEVIFMSIAAGLTAAIFVLSARHIADVGDLLGFAGAFVGAVMTIGGAIWFERRRTAAAELLDRAYLVVCIRRIEELASLTTSWAKDFDENTEKFIEVTAISLTMEIQSALTEIEVIIKTIRTNDFVKAKWSIRTLVNLEWLNNRVKEGLRTCSDSRFDWKTLTADPMAKAEYLLAIRHVSGTALVLSWRILLVLGELPDQVDHSRYPIDSADVVHRHQAGFDF